MLAECVEFKLCKNCSILKEVGQFHSHKYTKDGLRNQCKVCIKAYHKIRREGPLRSQILKQKIEYNTKFPNIKRASYLKRQYNMSLEDYENKLSIQHGKCVKITLLKIKTTNICTLTTIIQQEKLEV